MKYKDAVNQAIQDALTGKDVVCYGQNMAAGSCISGLCKNIQGVNVQNSENTLVGVGFGMMLAGQDSIYFMKQLDFLLLGVDHLVNTWNVLSRMALDSSFTIVAVMADTGTDGPQSSFTRFQELCAVADIHGFIVENENDLKTLREELVKPGFRVICVRQSRWNEEL